MNFRTHRGFLDPLTMGLVVGLAVGIVTGSWKPLNMFKKPPDTKQLTALQVKLDDVNKQVVQLRTDKDTAIQSEKDKHDQQDRAVQQDVMMAKLASDKVPLEHQTPEVKLTSRMLGRANVKLIAIIGSMPAEQQQELVDAIDGLLSDNQAKVDAVEQKLAALDAQFKIVTNDRNTLKDKVIPGLTQQLKEKDKEQVVVQAQVTTMTNKVKDQANKLYQEVQTSGSLKTAIEKLLWIAGGYVVIFMFVIPGVVKHLDPGLIKTSLRHIAGFATAPLLHWDATKKIPNTNLDSS